MSKCFAAGCAPRQCTEGNEGGEEEG